MVNQHRSRNGLHPLQSRAHLSINYSTKQSIALVVLSNIRAILLGINCYFYVCIGACALVCVVMYVHVNVCVCELYRDLKWLSTNGSVVICHNPLLYQTKHNNTVLVTLVFLINGWNAK